MVGNLAPDVRNYKRGGAQLLVQRTGGSGLVDLGNIPDHKFKVLAEYLTHQSSRSGQLVEDAKEKISTGLEVDLSTDEMNAVNLALIVGGAEPTAFTQDVVAAPTGTISIVTPVLGNKYLLGKLRVVTVVVKVGAVAKTEGTDYSLEPDIGAIRFLPTGTILATDTVDITFGCPAIAGALIKPFSKSGTMTLSQVQLVQRFSDGTIQTYAHSKGQLTFEGDLDFGGKEYAKASGTLLIQPDFSKAAADQWGVITQIPAAA